MGRVGRSQAARPNYSPHTYFVMRRLLPNLLNRKNNEGPASLVNKSIRTGRGVVKIPPLAHFSSNGGSRAVVKGRSVAPEIVDNPEGGEHEFVGESAVEAA